MVKFTWDFGWNIPPYKSLLFEFGIWFDGNLLEPSLYLEMGQLFNVKLSDKNIFLGHFKRVEFSGKAPVDRPTQIICTWMYWFVKKQIQKTEQDNLLDLTHPVQCSCCSYCKWMIKTFFSLWKKIISISPILFMRSFMQVRFAPIQIS